VNESREVKYNFKEPDLKPVSEILKEQGYTLDAALHHQELIPFVKKYIYKRNAVTLTFLLLNLLFVSLWLISNIYNITVESLTLNKAFTGFSFGIIIAFLLTPLHELLHGIAYRISGAHKISYKANWKKFYFMAIADKFITTRKSFYFVGLTPFVVISFLLINISLITAPGQQVVWLTALWMHAAMCSGDFGLISYFAENKTLDVITYDDEANSISYFYSRNL